MRTEHLVVEVEDGVEVRDDVEIIFPTVLPQELWRHLATLHPPGQLLRGGDEPHLPVPRHHQAEGEENSMRLERITLSGLGGAAGQCQCQIIDKTSPTV